MFSLFSKAKKNQPSLSELDELYRDTISFLTFESRISYCKRLIDRCEFDLKKIEVPSDKSTLENLLEAAKNEIEKLSSNDSKRH